MPRAGRSFEEGRTYHVYNRVAGGKLEFEDDRVWPRSSSMCSAGSVERDEIAVLGWSLLGNHYHMILRQGPVPLSRPMKSIQQEITREAKPQGSIVRTSVAGQIQGQGGFRR